MSEESYTVDGTVLGIALGVAFGAPTLVILVVFCCFSLSKRTRARLCHGYYCKKCCVQCCRKPCKQCCFKCKRCCCGRGSSKGKINSAPLLLSNFYGWLAARAAPSKEDIERYLKLYPFFMELASTTRLPFPSFDMLLIWFIHAVNPQDFITPAVLKSKLLVTPTPSADKLTKLWKVKYKVDYPAAPPTTVSTPSSFPVLSIDTALKRATALHNYAASMSTFSVTTCGLKTFRLRFVRLVSFYASHKTSAAPVPEYVTETRKLLIPPLPMEFVWQSFMLLPKKYSSITTGQYASGPLPHSVMIPRQQAVEAKLAFSRVWEEAFHEQLKLRPLPPSDPKPATTEPEPKPKPTKTHKKHQKHHHRKPSGSGSGSGSESGKGKKSDSESSSSSSSSSSDSDHTTTTPTVLPVVCAACAGCTSCASCSVCSACTSCSSCSTCSSCSSCSSCSTCSSCSSCSSCTSCASCSSCSSGGGGGGGDGGGGGSSCSSCSGGGCSSCGGGGCGGCGG